MTDVTSRIAFLSSAIKSLYSVCGDYTINQALERIKTLLNETINQAEEEIIEKANSIKTYTPPKSTSTSTDDDDIPF